MCRELLALVLVLAAGCCSGDFKVEDMESKRLTTPYDTLDYFRYALRQSDWDAVYGCLSAETRKFIDDKWLGRTLYGSYLARRELEDMDPKAPETLRHMKIVQLLHRAETLRIKYEPGDEQALVTLYYTAPEKETDFIAEAFPLILEKDASGTPRWTVGIIEWLGRR